VVGVDGVAGCGEVVEGGLDVDGVPADDGVGQQREAFALELLVAGVSASELALVGEEEVAAESVDGFAFVELVVDSSAVFGVVEPAEDGGGFWDAPVFLDGLGEFVLAGGSLESGDEG